MFFDRYSCRLPALTVNLNVISLHSSGASRSDLFKFLDSVPVFTCIVRDGVLLLVHPHAPATRSTEYCVARRTLFAPDTINNRYVTLCNYKRNVMALRYRLERRT